MDHQPSRRRWGRTLASAVSWVVLAAGYLVAGYLTVGSYLLRPDGISDPAIEGAWFLAAFGAIGAFVTGLAAVAVVRLVGWRALIVPVVLLILSAGRCSYINAVYPPPDW